MVSYLDKPEIDALLACPDRRTAQGRREHRTFLARPRLARYDQRLRRNRP
jgi:hypothetical protein